MFIPEASGVGRQQETIRSWSGSSAGEVGINNRRPLLASL